MAIIMMKKFQGGNLKKWRTILTGLPIIFQHLQLALRNTYMKDFWKYQNQRKFRLYLLYIVHNKLIMNGTQRTRTVPTTYVKFRPFSKYIFVPTKFQNPNVGPDIMELYVLHREYVVQNYI